MEWFKARNFIIYCRWFEEIVDKAQLLCKRLVCGPNRRR
jgi:hypothetical protein